MLCMQAADGGVFYGLSLEVTHTTSAYIPLARTLFKDVPTCRGDWKMYS